MKKISYLIEFFIVYIFFYILRLIPMTLVSLIGGKLFQIAGPLSRSHQTAIANYKKVFPDESEKEIKTNTNIKNNT